LRQQVAETHALRLALAGKRGVATLRPHTRTGINLDRLTTASMQPWARGARSLLNH
jgi:hypothetical protein